MFARQVGKTETIRRFAEENHKNLVEINFITEPIYKSIIQEGFSSESIVRLISRIDPGKQEISIFKDRKRCKGKGLHGIKLTAGNVGISDTIITFPYFCCFLLKRYMEKQDILK